MYDFPTCFYCLRKSFEKINWTKANVLIPCLQQQFSNSGVHPNHCRGLWHTDCWVWPPASDLVIPRLAWECILLTSSQILMMLIQGPHFENQWPRVTQTLRKKNLKPAYTHNMMPGRGAGATAKKAGWNQIEPGLRALSLSTLWNIWEHQKRTRPWNRQQVRSNLWFLIYSVVTKVLISLPSHHKEAACIAYQLSS